MQTCIPNQREPELDAYHLSGLEVLDTELSTLTEQVRRLQREGVDYMPLEDDNITTPVIASRRRGENPNAVMRLTNTILAELVENRLTGRYP